MKILIAISSCDSYERSGINQSQRDTWLPDAVALGMDYKFFHGLGAEPKDDVVLLDVDDLPGGLTDKLKAKVRYAFARGYDFVFACFPDTYAVPSRLLASSFDQYDYFGDVWKGAGATDSFYCHGGAGYFLSRKSCEIISKNETSYPNDDCWVGDVLSRPDVSMACCRDFRQFAGSPYKSNSVATSHLSDGSHHKDVEDYKYEADYMYREHQQWLDSVGDKVYIPTVEIIPGRSEHPLQKLPLPIYVPPCHAPPEPPVVTKWIARPLRRTQ
jgi:hypothetical protein